jgi:hypothetical protein
MTVVEFTIAIIIAVAITAVLLKKMSIKTQTMLNLTSPFWVKIFWILKADKSLNLQ